jgi:hypothetical protein
VRSLAVALALCVLPVPAAAGPADLGPWSPVTDAPVAAPASAAVVVDAPAATGGKPFSLYPMPQTTGAEWRDAAWQRRNHRLKVATWSLAAISGALLVVLAASTAVTVENRGFSSLDPQLQAVAGTVVVSGSLLGVSTVGLIGTGAAWGDHQRPYSGWRLADHPEVGTEVDPRTVPGWVARDRRLTRGMIGTLAFSCAMGVGLTTTLLVGIISERGCEPFCEGTLVILGGASFGTAGGIGMIAFSAIAGARRRHRGALAKWEARVAPGGLVLGF